MDRKEHKAWLARLAAEDRARRSGAEPELVRREALLRRAQAKLEATRLALGDLEAALAAARQDAAETDAEPDDRLNED